MIRKLSLNLIICAALLGSIAAAQATNFINSLSTRQEASYGLGVWGVPACILINGERPRGLYVTALAKRGLALGLGLEAGDVLISLNSRVVDSAHTADRIIFGLAPGPVKAVIARVQGNQVQTLSPVAELDELTLRWAANSAHQAGVSISSSGLSSSSGSGSSSSGSSSSASASAGGNTSAPGGGEPLIQLSAALESYMVELVNADRAKNGLPALKQSSGLSKLARDYALYIHKNNHFAHEDLEGLEPRDRAHRAGLHINVWENLAWRGANASYKDLVLLCEEGMMSEPPNVPTNHRGCILNDRHQTVGIGIVAVPPHKVICVQEFSPQDVP